MAPVVECLPGKRETQHTQKKKKKKQLVLLMVTMQSDQKISKFFVSHVEESRQDMWM
jgi:uncharacterized membrane protein YwzB